MATLLTCQGVSKAYGLRVLFDGLSLSLADEERVGLLGPNGVGKTTLLKIMAGLEPADGGRISIRRSARIAYLPQEERFPSGATIRTVLSEAIAEQHEHPHELETQVNITLSKFGFTPAHDRVDDLSGGWRKRLAVARECIRQPDLLLADEPTNHLDLEGIEWLEELLLAAPFAVLVISHDRYFLERVSSRVIELNATYPEGFFSVSGPYSKFLEKRADFLEAQQAQQATLANIVRREAAFLQSNAKAQRTKSKSRIEEAHRLTGELRDLQARNSQAVVAGIDFDSTGRKTRKLLEAQGLTKSLGGRLLFEEVSVMLSPGTRLGVLGANGSGKTTLIKVLAGELAPDAGSIKRAEGLQVVLFDQKRETLPQTEPLRSALSARGDHVKFRGQYIHVTGWAKRFCFRLDQLELPVGELSGGEQARVLIARLMLRPADVLILDEPTNDLDIASLDILEESLSDFPGAVVLVTHDRFMLDRLCTEVVGLDGAGHAHSCANYSQWQSAQTFRAREKETTADKPRSAKPQSRAKRKGLTASEEKELLDMEETIQEAELRVEQCRLATEDPQIAGDHVEAHKRWEELQAAQAHVDALYVRWELLEAKRTATEGITAAPDELGT